MLTFGSGAPPASCALARSARIWPLTCPVASHLAAAAERFAGAAAGAAAGAGAGVAFALAGWTRKSLSLRSRALETREKVWSVEEDSAAEVNALNGADRCGPPEGSGDGAEAEAGRLSRRPSRRLRAGWSRLVGAGGWLLPVAAPTTFLDELRRSARSWTLLSAAAWAVAVRVRVWRAAWAKTCRLG